MKSKNGPFMRDQFPGIPEAFSRETGKPKIRDFPGIPVPGIPGSKHYAGYPLNNDLVATSRAKKLTIFKNLTDEQLVSNLKYRF